VFQDGSVDTISPTSLAHGCVTFPMSPRRGYTAVACIPRRNNTEVQARLSVRLVPQSSPRYNGRVRPSEESRNNTNTLSRRPNWCWPTWAPVQRPRPPKKTQVSLASIVFPLNNFKHFLTLFSKFFASFPHGTCSLSVSCQYLALDGIYHPFRAALPSNPTRWKTIVRYGILTTNGVLTLHDPAFQLNSVRTVTDGAFYRLQFGLTPDLQVELFPLHSPLLRESLLVYFPPVS
jgi:hypothetical protein